MISYLKGTAVKVTPEHFPDIYAQLKHCCEKIKITEIPETYLMLADGAFNAFTTRFLGRNFMVLFSDVVDTLQDNPNSLFFYIGHETWPCSSQTPVTGTRAVSCDAITSPWSSV
ncbi:M48 family metalloprotease [Desulfosediminicola flagellatus]|uniref:M48 family metalloprotease n=1 Tax=Desulfosediminicola flagellatus TaxID=2569541 RepID=UPI0010AC5344|nr:M48 family metalloprotease [Desulfosediminicola flagellatus]